MKHFKYIILILGRFLVALALSLLPLMFPLKDQWYIIPLVVFNFIAQFVLAYIQMLPYFKKLIYK